MHRASTLVTLLVVIVACSRPKPVVAPEVALPSEARPAATPISPPEREVSPEPRVHPASQPEAEIITAELPEDVEAINRAGFLKDMFFDTDKADLREDARQLLAANATWLQQHPTVKILIEGHCDERNTNEYNLALGWRRANAVKNYLVSLGVSRDRISTISYGEEKPFALCHDESCWWQNRRAHFVVVSR